MKRYKTLTDCFTIICKECGGNVDLTVDECDQCGPSINGECTNCGNEFDSHDFVFGNDDSGIFVES